MMRKASDFTSYPLSAQLTRSVVNLLNIYRMVITMLLGMGHFGDLMTTSEALGYKGLANTVLVSYMVFAAYHLFSARNKNANFFRLATYSLMTDIVFLSLLVFALGGLEGSVGILLVFTCAVSAVLLPLRIALFLTSIAVLSIVGEAFWTYDQQITRANELVEAGLFGISAMVSAIIAHQVAYWARDYRLIAEKHREKFYELEQVNEFIIRRIRTGVLAVDHSTKIRVMNESAWFLMGSPPVRQRLLKSLSPRLDQALINWRKDPYADQKPVLLEPSQAQVLPSFVALPGDPEFGALIFLSDNNVVARRAVELSVNSLAKLSGSIAHEIRNPLAALNHAAQLLEESPQIRLAEMRLVNIIQNHAKRMNGIVENILQLSRREQSQPELVPLHTYLPEFGNEFHASQTNRELVFECATESDETLVLFDRSQLSQCLWKLLDNAVDHASKDRPIPQIRLELEKDESSGYCVITVADNGPGINKTQLTNIFEPFFTTRKSGSGLGLYIAKQICEANQAEITVDSELGEGAYFHIRLALAKGTPKQGRDTI